MSKGQFFKMNNFDVLKSTGDLASLTQLRDSLYGITGGRRAAIMVGSGFSRNAQLPAANSTLPPLWKDFEHAMSSRLYSDKNSGLGNALRLAEEFSVVYGRAALDDLIRQLVPDESWQPGNLHDRLLALPWTDVLTTNWDTLLERSAQRLLHRRYSVVRTVGDMAVSKAPRIVKLHGSMPSHTPFIFTEEDYRRYPTTHAPYVNLARQVFIENELVLIGFSGDDPNFLQWAGWVRDQLRDQSRRLYLVGLLDLPHSRRRLLESLNIAVVDLYPAVSDIPEELKHKAGVEMLLNYLEEGKPKRATDWPLADNSMRQSMHSAEQLRIVLHEWTTNRKSYPGWFLCPYTRREGIYREAYQSLPQFQRFFGDFSLKEKWTFVREVAWLCFVAGIMLPSWIIDKMQATLSDSDAAKHLDSAGKLDIALAIANSGRLNGDDAILEIGCNLLGKVGGDAEAWISYLRALRLRDTLQIAKLDELIGNVKGDDPAWLLRRAGMTVSVGRFNDAHTLYRKAVIELRKRSLLEPGSVWIESRLAWAELLARMTRGFDEKLDDDPLGNVSWDNMTRYSQDLDPWEEIALLRHQLAEEERQDSVSQGYNNPRFEAGIYHDEPAYIKFGPNESRISHSIRFVNDLIASTGDFGHVAFFRDENQRAAALANLNNAGAYDWAVSLCRSDSKSELLQKLFRRSSLVVMPTTRVEMLSQRMLELATYALDRCDVEVVNKNGSFQEHSFWMRRLNAAFEILSRISIRMDGEDAVLLHRTVLSWARRKALSHWWTHENYANLITRTWDAVPFERRAEFGLDHLLFPTAHEVHDASDMDKWPDPFDNSVAYQRTADSAVWRRRFDELVSLATASPVSRKYALRRLVHLHMSGILAPIESSQVGEVLWSRLRDDGFPADTGMYDFVVLEVPSPNGRNPEDVFWQKYLQKADVFQATETWLLVVGAGASILKKKGICTPDRETVRQWVDRLLEWRPRSTPDPLVWHRNEGVVQRAPWFLRDAVLPFIATEYLDEDFWRRFIEFVDVAPKAVIAVPYLIACNSAYSDRGFALVRRSLWHGDRNLSLAGALAILQWLEKEMPLAWRSLSEDVIALCTVPKHSAAVVLWRVLAMMMEKNLIASPSTDRVLQALEMLDLQADYRNWAGLDARWEAEAPLVISEAVRVANSLTTHEIFSPLLQKWIERPNNDPFPEVRWAKHPRPST